ncbi:MAG: hypothetical protein OXC62_00700 [Aestuariivita sp.]|nr:hypothetical protein [Aestuariivita sp.]
MQNITRQMDEIVSLLNESACGLSLSQIVKKISFSINYKTLQRRLAALVEEQRIEKIGERKAAKYYIFSGSLQGIKRQEDQENDGVFSLESRNSLKFLKIPLYMRQKMSYKRQVIDEYIPNETIYVPKEQREELLGEGKRCDVTLVAGTYARQICQRLLIDLSYNSSRLEGNTYSKLDTQKLVEEGIRADGKPHRETVMIMNHKEAILFLVENAHEIELNSFTLFNLHHLLSQDLLVNPEAGGRVRTVDVDIGQSTYKPVSNPHVLKELLELILLKARRIKDSFEQSFFY